MDAQIGVPQHADTFIFVCAGDVPCTRLSRLIWILSHSPPSPRSLAREEVVCLCGSSGRGNACDRRPRARRQSSMLAKSGERQMVKTSLISRRRPMTDISTPRILADK